MFRLLPLLKKHHTLCLDLIFILLFYFSKKKFIPACCVALENYKILILDKKSINERQPI